MSGRLLFDVTGLLHWYAYFRHPSGVQRVSEKLLGAISADANVEFVARVLGGDSFYRLDAKPFCELNDSAKRNRAIARLRAGFAQSMRSASLAELRKDVRLYHLPYVALGLARLESSFEVWCEGRRPQGRQRLFPLQQPCRRDVLFNPGDYWCHASYVDALIGLKQRTGLQIVQMVHDIFATQRKDWTHPKFGDVIVNQLHRLAPHVDRWLTNSQFVSSSLETYLKTRSIPLRPMSVLPMGWDNFASLRNEDKDDRTILAKYGILDIPYILHVGTVEPRKNLLALLEALQQLRAEGAARVPRCVLVGRDGWRSDPIRKRLKQTKNEGGTVYWFTDVSDAELPAFYRGARCTVVPSYSEGWGLPVQESLAYGVPCITSRIGGLPEVGKDLAVYFDPAQPDDLAKAIKSWILNDAALAEVRSRIVRFLEQERLPDWATSGRTLMRELICAQVTRPEPNGPTID